MAEEPDNFKPVFKHFKSRLKPGPDLTEASNFANNLQKLSLDSKKCKSELLNEFGLEPDFAKWEVFASDCGLYYVRNPFTISGQMYWAKRCLEDYARPPFKTNIDREAISSLDWYEKARDSKDPKLSGKLRWATLGYHHDWDTKIYSEDNFTNMPEDLKQLATLLSRTVLGQDFKPESSIVNFYPSDATLGPHTDHSEPNQRAPLFSISFGLNAVFLLGGKTKATKPTPMLLKSGDVLIMTGESRRFYHAVPKIVEKSFENSVNSTKVGENSTEVAANSVKVGENSTKLATNSVKVVENLTKVGKNSTNLGENSTKLDANLVKRVLNSTKVDETPTKLAKYSGKIAEKVGNPSEVEEKDSDFVSWYLERHRINVNIRQVH